MKKVLALLLVFCLTLSAFAIVETGQVEYTGGSVTIPVGTSGRFDLNRSDTLVFQYSHGSLTIPYEKVTKFRYEERLARHLGVALTIAVVLVKHRQRRHFVEVTYMDADNKEQIVLFEIAKTDVDSVKSTLEARTPQLRCPFKCRN